MAKGNEAYDIWWEKAGEKEKKEAFRFSDEYMAFLQSCKTEREVSAYAVSCLEKQKYADLDVLVEKDKGKGNLLAPGDKVYRNCQGKSILAAVIGKQPLNRGVNAIAAHIDSPRLDFKQNPFYEDSHLTLAKTHYYGGIKKYQWVCMPLALHGVVFLKNGNKVEVRVGDQEGDPCFVITDLLPHLAQKQMEKKVAEAVTGEGLNVLLGSLPDKEKPKEKGADQENAGQPVKSMLLRILKETYGVEERDFVSAEIEVVPALPVKDIGFDRSMIGGYGHDDRVCAYAALKALLDSKGVPEKTMVLYLADKEEVGSQGNTGAQSVALRNFLSELCAATSDRYQDLIAYRCFAASHLLSADVGSAVDPNFKDVQDPLNANYLGKGMVLEKYTGRAGKSGGSDANPEFIAALRQLFDKDAIAWQTGEIGKVDLGGGGTVAAFMANLGMQVVDCGVPVLSMHSPYEVVSKGDLYQTYLAYKTFFLNFG
ncbi:MAG: aminopeptidase [Clostridiales bacterium]|nr:aminopeptidase [Clostridiales bacterium]